MVYIVIEQQQQRNIFQLNILCLKVVKLHIFTNLEAQHIVLIK